MFERVLTIVLYIGFRIPGPVYIISWITWINKSACVPPVNVKVKGEEPI